jgi:pyruvate dehydrogenase E1 component alpha subunit
VRASGYGIPGITVDGNDVIAVYESAHEAVRRARKGLGPTLIEYKTYRMRGHFEGDHRRYQPKDEVEAWKKKDPIGRYRDNLTRNKILPPQEIERIERETTSNIEAAVKFAQQSPFPNPEETLDDVFCET